MAPNLGKDQHALIRGMLTDGSLSYARIAAKIPCSVKAVKRISANLHCYGSTIAPHNGGGRPRRMTTQMLAMLHAELEVKPSLLLDEMADLLRVRFPDAAQPSVPTISRCLRKSRWSRKVACHAAKERDPDLRDMYIDDLAAYQPDHLIFIDESGANRQDGFRRFGRSPQGTAAKQITRHQRGPRYQILCAYAKDGVLLSRVFRGTTDSAIFEDFISQLLTLCGRWPESKSVLVMDNASIHHSATIERLCADAGVKLVFLPPYSPDLTPIELLFARFKKLVKRHSIHYEGLRFDDFGGYLQWCVDRAGKDHKSAQNDFRHTGIAIDDCNV